MKLIYKPLTLEDRKDFFVLTGNPKVAATMRFDCPKTLEESDRVLADYLSEGNRTFGLRLSEEGPLIGVFAFKGTPGSENADLSEMLVPEHWGHGLGNQVLEDMVHLAVENRWYHRLTGYILEHNTASRRMAERMGFAEVERHRFPDMDQDLVVYSLDI